MMILITQVQVQQSPAPAPAPASSSQQLATITIPLPTEPVPKNQLGIPQPAEPQYVQPLNPAQITLPPSVASALQNLNQKAKPSSASTMVVAAASPQPAQPQPVKQEQMQILKQVQIVDTAADGEQLQVAAGGGLPSSLVAGTGGSHPQPHNDQRGEIIEEENAVEIINQIGDTEIGMKKDVKEISLQEEVPIDEPEQDVIMQDINVLVESDKMPDVDPQIINNEPILAHSEEKFKTIEGNLPVNSLEDFGILNSQPLLQDDLQPSQNNNESEPRSHISTLKTDVMLSCPLSQDEDLDFEISDVAQPADALASSQDYPLLGNASVIESHPNCLPVSQNLKEERHSKRMLLDAIDKLTHFQKNDEFISKFNNWLAQTATGSTISFKMGHLFSYPDSFLNFFSSQYCQKNGQDFNLMQFLDFHSDNKFVSVPGPHGWLSAIGGRSGKEFPSRRDECVKAYKNLLRFIAFELNDSCFDGQSIMKKRAIKDHISDIMQQTEDMKFHKTFKKMAENKNTKKKEMAEILEPTDDENRLHALETWFESDESQQIAQEAANIWKKAMKTGKIDKKSFNRFAQICFLELSLSDKLRVGVYYALTNQDWAMKKEVYLPAGYDNPDYDGLPAGWKLYVKPTLHPNASPSRYEIRIPGDRKGLKNKQRQVITLNLRVYELMNRYQDIKRILFSLDLESPFFVNFQNDPLPALKNQDRKGSLLRCVEKVTGIKKFCLKDTRKGIECQIQNNNSLKPHVQILNGHSLAVGSTYYDQLDGARRSVMAHCINRKEGSDLKRRASFENEEIQLKRAREDQKEKQLLVMKAENFLTDEKKRKPKDLSPSALEHQDVSYLSDLFKDAVDGKYK